MVTSEPGYLALYESGELARRAGLLEDRLKSCDICPRNCRVDRLKDERGFCHSGRDALVSSACAHQGEEPVLSGTRGSGTIFFSNCNLRCVYCQNYQISQDWERQSGNEIGRRALAARMIQLQDELHCHNINLVTPSHFVPQIVGAVLEAVPLGLHIPLVYNTSGYDSVKTLRMLEGIVDVYLPDLRYASPECARELSGAEDYVANARAAILEMYRQVGNLTVDENGVARRGLIVRLLILPNGQADVPDSLKWLASQVTPAVAVSVMAQYYPAFKAQEYPLLSRTVSCAEYAEVARALDKLGMEKGWLQEMDAPNNYVPDFTRKEHPFEPVEGTR
jgi:putative pyruvate formate lyase activating enzyme